jgi:3-oxoacyl-(acyl-carrier-protein) synthase
MNPSILINLLRDNPIVVTGMGCFSAAGCSVTELWETTVAGRSTAAWREFEMSDRRFRFAVCSAPKLDVSHPGLHPVRKMDRSAQMALLAAGQAWEHAGLAGAYPPEQIGIIAGSSRGPLGKIYESYNSIGRTKHSPSLSASCTFGSLGGMLAQTFKLRGPGATVSATCASAAFAIGFAAEQILFGKADAMLAGGAEAPLQPDLLAQLHASGVLGFHDEARLTCRPFDSTRNGLVPGEGGAFLVLESARAAARRGVRPLAQLAGWAMNLDNSGRVDVKEDGSGLIEIMRQALQMAELGPEQIDYVNAHGSGTILNDLAEARAIGKTFGDRAAIVPCSSTKPVTGHCLGATPAQEAVISIEALRHQMIPPTANCQEPDPHCSINAQPLTARPAQISTVMSNSLGFWGYHASLIFKKSA